MSIVDLLAEVDAVSDGDGVYTFSAPQTLNTSGEDWDVISLVSSTELSFVVQIDSKYIGSVVQIVDHDSNNQLSLSIDKGTERPKGHTDESPRKLILRIGDQPPVEFKYTPMARSFQTLSLALSNGNTLSFFVDHHPSGSALVTIPGNLVVGVPKGLVLFSTATPKNLVRVSLNQAELFRRLFLLFGQYLVCEKLLFALLSDLASSLHS